jgi:hypothetical protein
MITGMRRRQDRGALSAGTKMMYGAMFDEDDEGTAVFKLAATTAQVPAETAAKPLFVALDADGCRLPADCHLRVAGDPNASAERRFADGSRRAVRKSRNNMRAPLQFPAENARAALRKVGQPIANLTF